MEKKNKRPLINELTHGKELANQLRNYLDKTTSLQDCEFLVEKIVSSYEKALSMLNWSASLVAEPLPLPLPNNNNNTMESPNSFAETSPTSDNSDLDSKYDKNVIKKRKTMPKWSEQVRIWSGTMAEGPLGDGYSWRKYGQKDILGANFPRAYYRCTHRNVQGCLATKQVQRSDEDPSIIEITYKGRHSCIQATHLSSALASVAQKQVQNPKKEHGILESQPQGMQFNFGTVCLNKAKDFGTSEEKEKEIFPTFSFHSTPTETENMEGNFFLESLKEDNFMGSYSPPFISPAHNLHSSDSDLTDIISAPTSVTNSPMADFDFSLDHVDFESNLSFDILESEFFS